MFSSRRAEEEFCTFVEEDVDIHAVVTAEFPESITNRLLVKRLSGALKATFGFDLRKTLAATSVCSDEVCRQLEHDLTALVGTRIFAWGGLAGLPFGGRTAVQAMMGHVPKEGHLLIVFASHVGVDREGNVGKLSRPWMHGSSACCGSVDIAVREVHQKNHRMSRNGDFQQAAVGNVFKKLGSKISLSSAKKAVVLYKEIRKQVLTIVADEWRRVTEGGGQVAILGGVQINTPAPYHDSFLPMHFEIRNAEDRIDALHLLKNEV